MAFWRNAKKRTPKPYQHVLVRLGPKTDQYLWGLRAGFEIAYLGSEGWWWVHSGSLVTYVTHWKPLPRAPWGER